MKKAVICSSRSCEHKYHQDVNPPNIVVHHCPQCGSAGRMIMGPGQPVIEGTEGRPFIRPRFRLPEISLPVNKSYLEASNQDIQRLHSSVTAKGYTFVGFHGCGSNAAKSILVKVKNVSTTNSRGVGFAVGSLYTGIPSTWAGRANGGGTPTMLRIYVKNWHAKNANSHYQWGKMDPDDDIQRDGLEMILHPDVFNDIIALPSIGPGDQNLVSANIWANCPTHSFRPDELETVETLARHFNISLSELEMKIENDAASVEKAAKHLKLEI